MTREEYLEAIIEIARLSTSPPPSSTMEADQLDYLRAQAAEYEAEYWSRTGYELHLQTVPVSE
jgi:hypothetical protein